MSPGTFTNHTLLLDYLNQNDTIAVEIIDAEESDSAMNKKFDWIISTYTQYEMQSSLEFENPRDISQQSIDTVRVISTIHRFCLMLKARYSKQALKCQKEYLPSSQVKVKLNS